MSLTGLNNPELQLVFFGGKGGVGKTSCAVATAMGLSENFRTLLISTDPAHSVSDSLQQAIGFKLQPVDGVENLTAIEVYADAALLDFKEEHKDELKKLLETSTYLDEDDIKEMLSLSIPGIDEVMSFKTIINLVSEGNYDKYVVDTAPTGHALRLISSPQLLDLWIKVAAKMRWKYRFMMERFSGTYQKDKADDLLLSLKKTVKRIESILKDTSRSEFIPVCIPESMAILETERFLTELNKFGVNIKQMVINNVMESTGCDFCRKRKVSQSKHLQEIYDTFKSLNIVQVPLHPEEIIGIPGLQNFKTFLLDNHKRI
ncbi:MAG: ArsA family ATPase [Ignavibacteriota bacterium]|nr:ArsA family ATPase [Ignavibacteriota bacterium]